MMMFTIFVVAIALVTQINFCNCKRGDGDDHDSEKSSPSPGSRQSPQPGAGRASGESDSGDSRDGAGSSMRWLPFVIGGVAVAALLISLCAIALVLWLCCLRKRWRGRRSGTPDVVVIERTRDDKPFVYVVGSENEKKKEEEIAPPPYPGNVPRRPIYSSTSELSERPSEPQNYPPPHTLYPSAPPNSMRRVQSPSTELVAGQVAKDKSYLY